MRFILLCAAAAALCLLASCGSAQSSYADLTSRDVRLPNGQVIRAETMITSLEVMRGMMFRTSLAPDRGMLLIYKAPGNYPTWTYQVLIPLDLVWLDTSRNIVAVADNVPPCKSRASECPQYGGKKVSKYLLELAGGVAARNHLAPGQTIEF